MLLLSDAKRVEELKWRFIISRCRLLVSLVLFDLVSKAAGAAFWREGVFWREVDFWREVEMQGEESYLQLVLGASYRLKDAAAGGVGYLFVVGSLIFFQGSHWSNRRKILAGLAAYLIAFGLARVSLGAFGALPTIGLIFISRTGACVFYVYLWWLSCPGAWRLAMTLIAASALGYLSRLIPLHSLGDFMHSTFGSKVLILGLFNFAGLYFQVGLLCAAFVAGRALLRRLRRSRGAAAR